MPETRPKATRRKRRKKSRANAVRRRMRGARFVAGEAALRLRGCALPLSDGACTLGFLRSDASLTWSLRVPHLVWAGTYLEWVTRFSSVWSVMDIRLRSYQRVRFNRMLSRLSIHFPRFRRLPALRGPVCVPNYCINRAPKGCLGLEPIPRDLNGPRNARNQRQKHWQRMDVPENWGARPGDGPLRTDPLFGCLRY